MTAALLLHSWLITTPIGDVDKLNKVGILSQWLYEY
jgi:hypothetical protein